MRLLSFSAPDGRKSFGLAAEAGVVDLGLRLAPRVTDLQGFLAAGMLPELANYRQEAVDYRYEEIVFLPVIERPSKIFCVGMNYMDKRLEYGETIDAPTLFIRFADSLTGHACPLLKPRRTEQFDYEGELAVVIGKTASDVSRDEALSYVAGYSCFMDGSVRDRQHTWFTAGKNWRNTGAFGPWLVTADEVADPQALAIATYVNGQQVQADNTANMVRPVAELIEYISMFSVLSPGDVIITGSPGGVGQKRTPPVFLRPGDVVVVEIEKIGKLRNDVVADENLQ